MRVVLSQDACRQRKEERRDEVEEVCIAYICQSCEARRGGGEGRGEELSVGNVTYK